MHSDQNSCSLYFITSIPWRSVHSKWVNAIKSILFTAQTQTATGIGLARASGQIAICYMIRFGITSSTTYGTVKEVTFQERADRRLFFIYLFILCISDYVPLFSTLIKTPYTFTSTVSLFLPPTHTLVSSI